MSYAPIDQSDEAGFSLAELLVVVLLTGIVGVILMTTLISITTTSAKAQSKAQALNDARTALEVIARDLRAANPIDAVTPATAYRNSVRFSVYCKDAGVGSCGSNNLRQITYTVNNHRLQRTVGGVTTLLLGPSGTPTLEDSKRVGAIVNAADEPVFRYRKANGAELPTVAPTPPVERFRDCTKTVVIRLAVVSQPRETDKKIDLSTEVNLRNFNEVSGCLP